jgi:hypothetical protein
MASVARLARRRSAATSRGRAGSRSIDNTALRSSNLMPGQSNRDRQHIRAFAESSTCPKTGKERLLPGPVFHRYLLPTGAVRRLDHKR